MKRKKNQQVRYTELVELLSELLPHLNAFLVNEEDFRELRIKRNNDGSTLAIAKGYDADGGLVICFGVGYGAAGCLLAIDATINGGGWKVDKPWTPKGK